jgi:hypothetical protein
VVRKRETTRGVANIPGSPPGAARVASETENIRGPAGYPRGVADAIGTDVRELEEVGSER